MPVNLRGRSLLTLKEYNPEEIRHLLDLSADLKRKKRAGIRGESLRGKNVVLIFEKTSTRTRCSFEVAAYDEGGNVTFLTNSQMGKKESLEDTARVLGRLYDGIEYRGFDQKVVEALARFSGVPVWNGLTDAFHPTQALADLLTIREHVNKSPNRTKVVFVGDARNNTANSLMIGTVKSGMHYTALAPKGLFPDPALVEEMRQVARYTGGTVEVTDDCGTGVRQADVLYTDVWVSMGEEDRFEERIRLLEPYRVDSAMVGRTENDGVIFMHDLPACHDLETEMGRYVKDTFGLDEMEVSDEVFRSRRSVVFDQAENRMHTIKAVMVATIGGNP
jgi:ornithine carbamoyltransferase